MATVQQALAAATRPHAPLSERSAFLIGNVGKLGEEVLNALLEAPYYARVAVGVRGTMRTVVTRFVSVVVPRERTDWDPIAALGRVPDDLFVCLEPPRLSYWKVTTPYVQMTSEQATALARRLRAAGTRRLAVITPLEAMQQIGLDSIIRNVDEMALIEAGFERIVILRPSAEEQAASSHGFFQSVADTLLRTLRSLMMPKRLQPLRVRRVAKLAVEALATLENGVHVIGAARLREMVGEPDF